ncbi:hypothetical protein D8866_08965 [Streptococcus parasanguinis]|nr:hypothetical protein D8866_08965 [Streptococcus parasanguinis]
MASTFVVKPGFSTFGVEVASSTSSPIKLSSLGSPIARRVRRLPPDVSAVTAGVSVAGASTPAAISSFLFVVVEAASAALFAGGATSKLGFSEVVDVAGADDVADAAVLVLEAALVDAAAVDVAGAVIAAFAS